MDYYLTKLPGYLLGILQNLVLAMYLKFPKKNGYEYFDGNIKKLYSNSTIKDNGRLEVIIKLPKSGLYVSIKPQIHENLHFCLYLVSDKGIPIKPKKVCEDAIFCTSYDEVSCWIRYFNNVIKRQIKEEKKRARKQKNRASRLTQLQS